MDDLINNNNNDLTEKEKKEIKLKKEAAKQSKFVELIEKRMPKLLTAIKGISNLSDRRYYSYTDEDFRKIRKAINDQVQDAFRSYEKALRKKANDSEKIFKLRD